MKPSDRTGNSASEDTKTDCALSKDHISDKRKRTNTAIAVVAEHLWGNFPPNTLSTASIDSENPDIHKKYDFIFGTDLAYRNSLHAPLIATLLRFSHQHTLCLIGVTMVDTQPAFFDSLTDAGFRYEKLAEHLLGRDFRGSNFGIIAIQRR
jgi:hypothetical protein